MRLIFFFNKRTFSIKTEYHIFPSNEAGSDDLLSTHPSQLSLMECRHNPRTELYPLHKKNNADLISAIETDEKTLHRNRL